MSKINVKRNPVYTHEGARASYVNPEQQLRRSVMACLLWENTFYECGESVADRIKRTIPLVSPEKVAAIAKEARNEMKLRHIPLLIVREMARLDSHKYLVADTLQNIIQRPDELTEFLAIYWKDGRQPLSAQVKRGLASAFCKFSEYQLAKYNRNEAIKLRDVLFLSHARPKDKNQDLLWKRLIDNALVTPDTWEVALSSGADKKSAWERLIKDNKLGALAYLRNLRNMEQAGLSHDLIVTGMDKINPTRVLPFRFIAAAIHAPYLEDAIEKVMYKCMAQKDRLLGKTILIVDVSGSMYGGTVSKKSSIDRAQAACALAVLVREQCESPRIYATAGSDSTSIHATALVPPRRGFALSDFIFNQRNPLGGGGIFLKQVMDFVYDKEKSAERIVVITDEQDCDVPGQGDPAKANAFGNHNYILNVNTYENGIGYGKWTHINGFSEAVLDYIYCLETSNGNQSTGH